MFLVGRFIILLPSKYLFSVLFYSYNANEVSDYGGKRQGNRVVSLGEISYFDPMSKSRRSACGRGLKVGITLSGIGIGKEGLSPTTSY